MGPVQKTMSTLSISEGPVKDCIKDTSSTKATSEGPVWTCSTSTKDTSSTKATSEGPVLLQQNFQRLFITRIRRLHQQQG